MARVTYPSVPHGRDIANDDARTAALRVREWYECSDESTQIGTEDIVRITRWVLWRTRQPTPTGENP